MPIIDTIEGNLITLAQKGRYTEISHGANCFCVMGAGIAPQIAKAFPEAEEADNDTIRGDKSKLGDLTFADVMCHDQALTVYNLYTQYGTRGRAEGIPDIDYSALRMAFMKVNADVAKLKGNQRRHNSSRSSYYDYAGLTQLLGIPQIGAGLAGGDWDIISKIINEVTPDVEIELVLYKP